MNRIHPLSVLLGLALAGLCLLTMAPAAVNASAVLVQYMPHPTAMVQIREGTPYVVPAGKLFVLTGLGATGAYSNGQLSQLLVNGQEEASVRSSYLNNTYENLASSSDIVPVPPGLTASAGSILTVTGGGTPPVDTNARAWGYLSSL